MTKYLIKILLFMSLVVILFNSCGLSTKVENGIDMGFRSILLSQVAMTTFLIESSKAIFENDSIELSDSIYFNYLQASFISPLDTFYLQVDSFVAMNTTNDKITFRKVTFMNDQAVYDSLDIPYLERIYLPDTLNVDVVCKYKSNVNFESSYWKWLHSDYNIEDCNIKLENKWFK